MPPTEHDRAERFLHARAGAREDAALIEAFTTLVDAMRSWSVPSSRNRGMFSTWGEQWALLDGFVIERDEPEHEYDEPIDGYVAAGELVVQLLRCQSRHGERQPFEPTDGPSLERLHATLAWQLEERRVQLEARLARLSAVEEVQEASSIAASLAQSNSDVLPSASTPLNYSLVAMQSQPKDVSDLFVKFEERLLQAPLRTLSVSADGTVHRTAYSECAGPFADQGLLDRATLGEVADRLCENCYPGIRWFISSVLGATPTTAPGRSLTYVAGGFHGASMAFVSIVRYAVTPWSVVAEDTTMTDSGVRFARDGQFLQTSTVPAHVAVLIEEMLRQFETSNVPVSLVLD